MNLRRTIIAVFMGFALLLSGCGSNKSVDKTTRITEFTKPAVVRVVSFNAADYNFDSQLAPILGQNKWTIYDGGTGSGANIAENGYIVTNAHVVEASHLSDTEAIQALDTNFFKQLRDYLSQRYNQQQIEAIVRYATNTTKRGQMVRQSRVILPGGDVYSFDIKTYGAPIGQGKDVAIIKIDAKNLPIVMVDDTDSAKTADHIMVAGYPGAADLNGFLDDKSQLVSSYTSGTISAKKTSDKGPVLQMDANINPGNSGGPVFNDAGKLVGIATATSSEGIGWAIPASTILEFARQANSPINQPGAITKLWQDGLELYWQDRYSAAIPKLEEVQRLYSKHYGVTDYLAGSEAAITQGKDHGSGTGLWVALAVVIGATGIWFWRRRSRVVRPLGEIIVREKPAFPDSTVMTIPAAATLQSLPQNHTKRGFVRGLSTPFQDQVFEVGEEPLIFGTDPARAQVLYSAADTHQTISPEHALLIYDPATHSFLLEDGPSKTGTFLSSGERVSVSTPARLLNHNRFYLGSPEFVFEVYTD